MAKRILKPLGYSGMLDEIFDIYKKNFLLLAGIAGIIYLPGSILYNYSMTILKARIAINRTSASIDIQNMILSSDLTLVIIFLYFSLSYIVTAAITWAVSRIYLGDEATIMQSYKAVMKRIVPFALTTILVMLLVTAGTVLFIIPGIIAILFTAFVSEIFIIEGKQYTEAIKRSFDLVKGEWMKVLVFGLLISLIQSVISIALASPFLYMHLFQKIPLTGPMLLFQGFAKGIAQSLTVPIQVIAFVLLYYDIRIRKEGFDIEMLTTDLGNSTSSRE
jgi:hypothetical protein